jgi:hypothetical protein
MVTIKLSPAFINAIEHDMHCHTNLHVYAIASTTNVLCSHKHIQTVN